MEVHELSVGALLDDTSVVEDNDIIGSDDSGEPMGDDDGGASTEHLIKSSLEEPLTFCVECRGGFVEDEQAGVAEESTSNADALALTAREEASPFAERGVVAFGEAHDEFVSLSVVGGFLYPSW